MSRALALLAVAILAACSTPEPPSEEGRLVCIGCDQGFSLQLPTAATGGSSTSTISLVNAGGAALPLEPPAGRIGPFHVALSCGPACDQLAPGEQLEVRVVFRPVDDGEETRKVDLGPALLELRGEAIVPDVECEPDPLAFGNVVAGRMSERTASCTNRGLYGTTLTVEAYTATEPVFSIPAMALELPAGATRLLPITFSPTAPGAWRGGVRILAGSKIVAAIDLEGEALAGAVTIPPPQADCYDVGVVAPGSTREIAIPLRNDGDEVVEFEQVFADAAEFSIVSSPASLAPGASDTVVVRFHPTEAGTREANLLATTSAPGEQPTTCVRGIGGGPRLLCESERVEFGLVASSGPKTMSLRCRNDGWAHPDTDERLRIHGLESESPYTAGIRGGAPAAGYALGESFFVDITFAPDADGVATRTLRLQSNDSGAGIPAIELFGDGRVLPPCDFAIATPAVDFRNVDGLALTLDAVVRNVGRHACVVAPVGIEGSRRFGMKLMPARELTPGDTLRIPVTLDPTLVDDSFEGELLVEVSASPSLQRIPLRGASEARCQPIVPIDFREAALPGCSSPRRTASLWSRCGARRLVSVELLEQGGPFRIVVPPDLAGDSERVEVELEYAPETPERDEAHHGGLVLRFDTGHELLVPLLGQRMADGTIVDRFGGNPVDVLFVIDSTYGGRELPLGFEFFDTARNYGLEYQSGMTGAALIQSSCSSWGELEHGRLAPEEGGSHRILRSSRTLEEQQEAWTTQASSLTHCSWHEAGLEMSFRALSAPLIDREAGAGNLGFLRHAADLEVVQVIDPMLLDESPSSVAWYVDFLRSRKWDGRRTRLHVFDSSPVLQGDDRYGEAAAALRGASIPWSESAARVHDLAREVFRVERCLPLSDVAIEDSIEVRMDGVVVQRQTPSGDAWTYDATANEVCFREASRPEPGEGVEIRYQRPCLLP